MELKDKRVLVTGADGFIGSHLVEALCGMGCHVKALVLYTPSGSWGCLDLLPGPVRDGIEVFRGDVRDRGTVAKAMDGAQVVFHLAAMAGVPYSLDAPQSYVDTNVSGTLNILEEARRTGCERVVVTSTAEVYGVPRYIPLDEEHPCQARSPYGATKIAAERLAESYHRSFDLPVSIVRPFNTYGPRQSTRAIIPAIVTQLLAGQDEIKVGDLTPTRDMVFVADTVRGFVEIARSGKAIGHEINIATGREVAIGEIIRTLVDLVRPAARIVVDPERVRLAEGQEERIYGSHRKLLELTGWAPGIALEEGLARTVRWFGGQAGVPADKSSTYNS